MLKTNVYCVCFCFNLLLDIKGVVKKKSSRVCFTGKMGEKYSLDISNIYTHSRCSFCFFQSDELIGDVMRGAFVACKTKIHLVNIRERKKNIACTVRMMREKQNFIRHVLLNASEYALKYEFHKILYRVIETRSTRLSFILRCFFF